MKNVAIIVGLVSVVAVVGCGGSLEHEQFESPEFSGHRTGIHIRSHEEPSGSYRVAEGQPIHLHYHAANGQSLCVEITTVR